MDKIEQSGLQAPEAPKSETRRSGGLLSRFGLGGGKASAAPSLLKTLEAQLPDSDPLRRARVQTHLFQAQMPAFPAASDAQPRVAVVRESSESDASLSGLRAEKAARADQRAQREAADAKAAAEDPGRRRAQALRDRRQSTTPTRPASSLRPSANVGRAGAASARAAAERAPARTALSNLASSGPAVASRSGGRSSSRSLSGMLLLIMLLTLFLIAALIWYGYGWYRDLQAGATTSNAAIEGVFDDPVVPEEDASQPAETAIPTVEDAPIEPEPEVDDIFVVEAPVVETPLPTPTELEAQAYEDAVFLIERGLNVQSFLRPNTLVDGIYSFETRAALLELTGLFGYSDLEDDIIAAGLNPTRQELESWYAQIEPLF